MTNGPKNISRSKLGPRFYDWQLAQTPEESWKECHIHARNLLGEEGYDELIERIEAEKRGEIYKSNATDISVAEENKTPYSSQIKLDL
jgi:hypothetical protein